jgi:hypothetical protein
MMGRITRQPDFRLELWLLMKYDIEPMMYYLMPNSFVAVNIYSRGFMYSLWKGNKSFFFKNFVTSCFKKSVPNNAVFSTLLFPNST